MRTGRPKARLLVTTEQRETLESWARRRTTAQALALRARIVLSCSEGGYDGEIAQRLGINRLTVGRWRRRFIQDGVDGLFDEPRPGAPRQISDANVERVVPLKSKPKDATHWSTRSMAQRTGLSQSAIVRIWRAFGLQPHRFETFKLSTDPLFVEKVGTSSAYTWTLPTKRWCSVWTKSPRFKPSIGVSLCSPCVPAKSNDGPMTTRVTARPRSSLRWMRPAAM
jgi:transposase